MGLCSLRSPLRSLGAVLLTASIMAVAPARADEGPSVGFPEYPALSPDGDWIVFSWAGDLWITEADGGRAARLTSHPAEERRALFSPDGASIAFESDREGARNLYIMDLRMVDGWPVAGEIRAVTRTDRAVTLSAFSADGNELYYTARKRPGIYRMTEMYRVSVDGGPVTSLTSAYGLEPRPTPDGDAVVFSRGYWEWERPAYRGTGALDLWRLDLESGDFTRLTSHDGNDGNAYPLDDGSVVFLSSRDGQNNLYRLRAGAPDDRPGAVRALTAFMPENVATIGHGVRDLHVSGDGDTAVFAVWDTLYTLDLSKRSAEPRALSLYASVDANELDFRRADLDRQVSEAALSPDGKTMAVVARGEVFVRATADNRPTRRVTHTAARERDLAWSPCGTTLYFVSDEPGHGVLRAATVSLARIDIKPEDDTPDEDADAESPDNELAGDEPKGDTPKPGAHRVAAADPSSFPGASAKAKQDAPEEQDAEADDAADAKDDKKKDVDPGARWAGALRFDIIDVLDVGDDLSNPVPSPDGAKLLLTRGRGDLLLHTLAAPAEDATDPEASEGQTRVLFEHWSEPEVLWAPDSRHVVFSRSDLDFNNDIWLMDTESGEDAFAGAVNLTRHPDYDASPRLSADGKVLYFLSDRDGDNWSFDVYAVALDRALEGKTEYELDEYFEEAAKAARKRKPVSTKPDDEKKVADALTFHADDAYLRVRRVFDATGSASDLQITPGGERILFSTTIDGTGALYSVDFRGRERKTVHRGSVGGVEMSLTGDLAYFVSGGQAHSAPPSGGKLTTYNIDAPVVIDVAQEQRQKFLEAARALGAGFYHPTLKGLDWDALTQRYLALAMQTRTASAFNRVGNLLFGELNGSHLGMWGGGGFSGDAPETGYLAIDASPVAGGFRIDAIIKGGPADRAGDELAEGDIIVAIDDLRLAPADDAKPSIDLLDAMGDTRGRETLFEVRDADDSSTKFVIMTPTSFGGETNLRYDREVERRRQRVHELSDGRLGYLHIRSMGAPSVRDFERDLFAAAEGREGLVIDVRDNGGGWTTDILLASLTAPAHAYTIPRGASAEDTSPLNYPRDRRLIYAYQRPITVLINENSFSNAEIFAHSIKTVGRGSLVGTATYGGVISTGAIRLIDGTTVRMPFRGWFLTDGTDMENNGAQPDIDVPISPADEAANRDPQLEAAVDHLLKQTSSFEKDMHRPRADTSVHPTIERLGLDHPLAAPAARILADREDDANEPEPTRGEKRAAPRGSAPPSGASQPASAPAGPDGPSADAADSPGTPDTSAITEDTEVSTPSSARLAPAPRALGFAAAALTGVASAVTAAENAPQTRTPSNHGGMIRQPDVSGEHIVFVYANDLWIVPRAGGMAKPLASPPGAEDFPRFSPDGRHVAFIGNYDGDRDIYRVPIEGGVPERLTHHPANEVLCDWTESSGLLFFQDGLAGLRRMDQIFTLDPTGGMPNRLPVPYGAYASLNDDGTKLAYVQHDRDGRHWKRYRGGLASDIWLFDLQTKQSQRITDFEGTDSQPMWHGETIYYMSDAGPEHRRNIWSYNTRTGQRNQVTDHSADDIKWPAIGPGPNGRGEIVYQLGEELRLLDLATGTNRAVDIQIPGAKPTIRPRIVDAAKFIAGASPSPTGKRVAVEARGDLWTAPAKHGTPVNLSRTSGAGERNPSWSPCGQWIAYQSDQTGEHELYVRQSDGKDEPRQLTDGQRWFIEEIVWAPKGPTLAMVDQTGDITLVDVTTGARTRVDTDPNAGGTELSWSHDGAWLAYSRSGDEAWTRSIWLYEVAANRTTQVTSDLFNDSQPTFDRKGDYFYFATNRAFTEPAYEDVGSTFVYNRTDQLAVVPLRADVESPFAPVIDTVTWDDEDADEAKEDDAKDEESDDDAKDDDNDDNGDDAEGEEKDEEKDEEPLKIDLAGFEARAELVPVGRGQFPNLAVADGGALIFAHAPGMPGGGDGAIKHIDLSEDEPEAKDVLEGATNFAITADGKKLLVAKNGAFAFIDPKPGQSMKDTISTDGMEVTIDPRAEWRQIFFDAWRRHRDYFYDPNMHGLDWDAVGQRYAKMLEHAVSRDDVSFIIGEMIAELNVGHAYYWGGDVEEQPSRSVGLLGADYELHDGAYRVTRILDGADWDLDARGPLTGKDIEVGDYILAVNGVPIDTSKDIWASFLGLAGKTVSLTVSDDATLDDEDTEIAVEPIGDETALRYRDWVESNRAAVETASSGRIGYIHVPDTGVNGQNELFRQFYGQMHKDALIIDERWNGGGQVPTRFIELLNRPRVNYFARRHGRDTPWPPDSHQGPKAMLANGPAGSGGDAFPWYFKKMGIGPVIGTRTWGGLVGIGGVPPLIDGGYTAVPNWAFYETDGTWGVEGHGVDPDIEVIDDPALMWDGGDPQLDTAIRWLQRELETKAYQPPARPAYPDRSGFGLPESDK